MNNILITSAGQRVSLVKAFQKELKTYNLLWKVYTCDNRPELAPACQISDGYFKVPRATDETYIESVLRFCIENRVSLLVPTIDTELLVFSENKQKFKDKGITVIVSSPNFVKICRDKRLSNSFFINKGIDIPRQMDKSSLDFPLFIKPYDGSLSKDTYIIKSRTELRDVHFGNPKLMFMEYIDPTKFDEFTVDAYYDRDGILICAVPRKRIFVRAGEVNKALTKKHRLLSLLKDCLSEIKGAAGCLTIQVFYNDSTKKLIGIEINPRFGGGYPLSYLSGANYPKLLIEEYFLGKKLSYHEDWESNLLMLRFDSEVLVHNYEN